MSNRTALTFTITGTSPSSATTAVIGSAIDTASADGAGNGAGLEEVDSADIVVNTLGATGGTLDLVLQTSPDNVTFTDWVHLTQIAAAAAAAVQQAESTHSAASNPVAVGQGTNTVLAATTVAGGPERYIRLIGKGGASTTAGAVQTAKITVRGERKQAA